jgi:Arc/MetJ-type ribon-helix-helix transcriptional regulator
MKTMVSEKRTQVYFPKELYRRIEKKAKNEAKSSAAVIREAVERYLATDNEKEIDWENDPFFKAVGFIKSGVTDMSVNHDHYLYGVPKKSEAGKK